MTSGFPTLDRVLEVIDSIPVVIIFVAFSAFLFPFARFVFPHIRSSKTNALIHIVYGLIMSIVIFRSDTILCLLMAIVTFVGIKYFSVSISITIATLSLLASHIVVMMRPIDWALDMTGMTMVMFQKAVSLTFNVADGRLRKSGQKIKRPRWEAVAVDECPSFFIYLAYLFTPYGSFSNPFLEFKLFEVILNVGCRYIPSKTSNNTSDSSKSDSSKSDSSKSDSSKSNEAENGESKDDEKFVSNWSRIPQVEHKIAFKRYLYAFVYAAFVQVGMIYISMDSTYKASWFEKVPLLIKPIVMAALTAIQASRYFPAWMLVDSGFYEFGLGSAGIVEHDEVSNLTMIDTLKSPTCDEWMRRWNHTTHLFWKNYLFTRLLNNGFGKGFSNMMVFICSMAWHGIRFIYLGMLPEAFLCMKVDAFWNQKFPQKDASSFIKFLHNLWVVCSMLYCTSTWYYPSFEDFLFVRKKVSFIIPIIAVFIFIIVLVMPKKKEGAKPKVE
ncbi:MBOAT family protein [Tritrichomonas foetus]|uniref:MBOAT family protein n=1 Tax=Tritrichomonas foetus TaxID=1144522 RepID=A0A1J4K2H1_9EUKA|nr:MBOAT family protein [Tritrichomonas foetus]|eukprot:OHT05591.1 MBOAT family protein [Tritrichomonas foetus]